MHDHSPLCCNRGAEFHFFDATDDIIGADLDLLLERDRLYLHNASGYFGSVPMTLTGGVALGCSADCRLPIADRALQLNSCKLMFSLVCVSYFCRRLRPAA